ncbi:hypothetical protein ACJX0J_009104, partial [Zea mays]
IPTDKTTHFCITTLQQAANIVPELTVIIEASQIVELIIQLLVQTCGLPVMKHVIDLQSTNENNDAAYVGVSWDELYKKHLIASKCTILPYKLYHRLHEVTNQRVASKIGEIAVDR